MFWVVLSMKREGFVNLEDLIVGYHFNLELQALGIRYFIMF